MNPKVSTLEDPHNVAGCSRPPLHLRLPSASAFRPLRRPEAARASDLVEWCPPRVQCCSCGKPGLSTHVHRTVAAAELWGGSGVRFGLPLREAGVSVQRIRA
jgi:hypothetical protein